tara:strand:- start:726 stop:926 length:201 start_codon:yes stop_codon:yes gene_type:complete
MEDEKIKLNQLEKKNNLVLSDNQIHALLSNSIALEAFINLSERDQAVVNMLLHNIGCDTHPLNIQH